MANVLFKRGIQSALPTQGTEGVFYLTTDTNRLYVGQRNGEKPILLNQAVNFVAKIDDLTTISNAWDDAEKIAHLYDIYYVLPGGGGKNTHKGNILAVWAKDTNGVPAWIQINPDHNTSISEISDDFVDGNNRVDSTFNVLQNDGKSYSISFAVEGSGKTVKVDLGTDEKSFLITGDTYTLSRPSVGEIKLNSALNQEATSVKLVAGSNVTITNGTNNNEINIAAKDTRLDSVSTSVTADGKIEVIVSDTHGTTKTGTSEAPTITYGGNEQYTGYLNGKLNVYGKDEIDAKLKNLNGLTYRGTVGAASATFQLGANDYKVYQNNAVAEVHVGDMFLVSGEAKYSADAKAKTGDLLIATGTENANGVLESITWTFVPSGDDATLDTTYNFTANGADKSLTIESVNSLTLNQAVAGKMVFKDGTDINVSAVAKNNDKELEITVNHKSLTEAVPATGTAIDLNNQASANVITGVEVSPQGHVTKVYTSTLKPSRYELAPAVATKVVDGATVGFNVKQGLILGTNNAVYQADGYTFKSTSLDINVNTAGDEITVNYVWGSF